jgi:hypothetical protein
MRGRGGIEMSEDQVVPHVALDEDDIEGRERASDTPFYCQRCKEGVFVPERELRVCPDCARSVCSKCRVRYEEIEGDICLDCARVKRAQKRSGRQALMHWLRALLSIALIGAGVLLALRGEWLIGAITSAIGVVGIAWHLTVFHRCPLCYGKAKPRRKKGRLEYQCTLCGHVWSP